MTDTLTTTAAAWNIALDDEQQAQFASYAAELRDWNQRINLTAITDPHGITTRHFLDSLACANVWGRPPRTLIDIGTGAGFPGIPLKIAFPSVALTLVESVEKKANFLRHVVALLDLRDVEVLTARAETIGREQRYRERYDLVVARAVAELRVLAEYCLPLVRVGGRFLAPKGAQIAQEVHDANTAITLVGGRLASVEPVIIPDLEQRSLVVVDKIRATPAEYPRDQGQPKKYPL